VSNEQQTPAYGEYATPEQQAAAMGVHRLAPQPPIVRTTEKSGDLSQSSANSRGTRPRSWDLILTALLLAYGLWNVISGLVRYSRLSTVAQEIYTMLGLGTFTSSRPGLSQALGLAINVSDVVIFAVVAFLSYRLVSRGRIAFWVPLTGGVIATIIGIGLLFALLSSDPGFAAHFTATG